MEINQRRHDADPASIENLFIMDTHPRSIFWKPTSHISSISLRFWNTKPALQDRVLQQLASCGTYVRDSAAQHASQGVLAATMPLASCIGRPTAGAKL